MWLSPQDQLLLILSKFLAITNQHLYESLRHTNRKNMIQRFTFLLFHSAGKLDLLCSLLSQRMLVLHATIYMHGNEANYTILVSLFPGFSSCIWTCLNGCCLLILSKRTKPWQVSIYPPIIHPCVRSCWRSLDINVLLKQPLLFLADFPQDIGTWLNSELCAGLGWRLWLWSVLGSGLLVSNCYNNDTHSCTKSHTKMLLLLNPTTESNPMHCLI